MAFFSTLRSKSVLPSLGKYYYDDPKNKVKKVCFPGAKSAFICPENCFYNWVICLYLFSIYRLT